MDKSKRLSAVTLPHGVEPEWVSVNQACVIRGCGRSTLYKEIAADVVESAKRGKRRVIRLRSAREA